MKKIRKKHIVILLIFLIPFWFIGISNYFFASSSFISIDGNRVWTGDTDGLLMTLAINVTLIGLWAIGLYTGYLDRYIDRMITRFQRTVKFVKDNPGKTLQHIGIILAIVILALITEMFFSRYFSSLSFSAVSRVLRIAFYISAGLSVYLIFMFRARPEALFLSLSLLIGFFYIVVHPFFWYGWDCGIHYAWSVEESFFRTVSVSSADYILGNTPEFYSFFEYEKSNGYSGLLQNGNGNVTTFTFLKGTDTFAWSMIVPQFLYHRIAHIPAGLMIFIGRSIDMAPVFAFRLGMVANHVIYTLLVYFAMKRLNSGKYIMAVIAMFPTSFVLSTTYGYDYWVIGFLMLGFAYFFNEIQNPDTKIDKKNLLIMVVSFFIGVGPKPPYFLLMLVLFFVSKKKFGTKRGYRVYIITVLCLILIAFASFAVPFILEGGGEGDWRFDDVNGASQVDFILQNPGTFLMIFMRFLISYLNIFTQNFFTYYAHFRDAAFHHLIVLLMIFVTITDRSEKDLHSGAVGYKSLTAIAALATIALFSLAMYIGNTVVGADTIAGVQGRYLIPMMFPVLYVLGSFNIKNNINKTAYSCCVFGIISFILLAGAWEKFILIR